MCREAGAKPAGGRDRRGGGARRRKGAGLKNAAHFLWKPPRPTARKRGVIVDINVWTPHDRHVEIHCVDQNKRLAILITSRLKIFVVLCRELPIQEHHDAVTV